MVFVGVLLVVWGGVVAGSARFVHESWRGMNRRIQGAGIRDRVAGTAFIGSPTGLRVLRIGGAVVLAVGVVLVVVGLLGGRGG